MTNTKIPVPKASELMNRHPFTATCDMSLLEVVRMLLEHKVSNAPVVQDSNDGKQMVGFISEKDCLEHLSNDMFFGNPSQQRTAESIMRRHPMCVSPDDDVFSLASVFVNSQHRHMPVVKDGKLLGIVSRRDLLKTLEHYYELWLNQHNLDYFPPDLRQLVNLRFVSRRT